ncbi:MAG: META domain-containing protein, partial [Bdellovibrio bacteriovorus]
ILYRSRVPMLSALHPLVLASLPLTLALVAVGAPFAAAASDEAQSNLSPVASAGADAPAAAGQPVGSDSGGIEGLDWALAAYRVGDTLVELDDPQGPARLRFEDGRVSGSAGCNRLMGAYVLEGEALRFEPPMAATMMACPEPLMAQEQAVHAALAEVASLRRDADRLELLDGEGALVLRFVALRSLSLVGPVWEMVAYNNGRQAIVSALAGAKVTLELREDGTLGGVDGCNRFMSGFTLEADRLTIGPIATTRMACRGPEGVAEQAAAFAQALGTVTGYRIEGNELTLLTAEGTPAARFRADR